MYICTLKIISMETLVQVDQIAKSYGDIVLFNDITFSIIKGEKSALIAKNGAGKSTILKIMGGYETADKGDIIYKNDMSFGYLSQEPQLNDDHTILEATFFSDNETVHAVKNYEQALRNGDAKEIEKAMEQMDRMDAWDFEVEAKQILTELSINQYDKQIKYLSGGERKRVALAHVLLTKPDLLVLDEPTNHLDLAMIEWLEDFLKKSKSTLFMVTHDRYFLDRICTTILELEDNVIYRYDGNYEYYLEKRKERIEVFNANTEKARQLLKNEEAWVKRMPKARGTKAKYRIDNYRKLKERVSQERKEDELDFNFKTQRLGKKVINAHGISKTFDENTPLVHNFTYKFTPGEKIGIVGANGSGKSTLLNMLTRELEPDQGYVDIGETVSFGYYKQQGIEFDESKRLIEIIQDIAEYVTLGNDKQMPAAQFLEYFLFPKNMHYNYVAKLSGGEKRRLYLMTVLMHNPNFLILDEPTNDLDILTLNVLEDYLAGFKGCVLIVSHDRYFMDKVVDKLFVFEGEGKVREFPGNYTIYRESEIKQNKGKKAATHQGTTKKRNKPKETRNFRYKHKLELETIEKELEQLEQEKQALEKSMNSGELSGDELSETSQRFKELMDMQEEKELRWLELNELKEMDEKQ